MSDPTVRQGRPWKYSVATVAVVLGLGVTGSTAIAWSGGTGPARTAPGQDRDSTRTPGDHQPGKDDGPGRVRTYHISADETVWDYAPGGKDLSTGKPFGRFAQNYVHPGPGRIGSRYLKCRYRAYTDSSFTTPGTPPTEDAYLGLLGPVIRAEVGDRIVVDFRNTCRIPTSIHPHGVFYTKANEGAPYADGTSGADRVDDAVPQGGRHTYVWEVPERAGPGPHDGSSVMWMYHSHSSEATDTNAGLMGPLVVTGRGMARADGSPADVDREVFELFSNVDENHSPYLAPNIDRFTRAPRPKPRDEAFQEANVKHAINGYVYGNQPMITLTRGERVRWYVMGMGSESDLHTPHWHGTTVTVGGMRMDMVNLMPATMTVADMVPDSPGTWLFHCHVNEHLVGGMVARYRIVDRD